MSDKTERALRFIASGGWADEDSQVVAQLLNTAAKLARDVVADPGASPALKQSAQAFLDDLEADTPFGDEAASGAT